MASIALPDRALAGARRIHLPRPPDRHVGNLARLHLRLQLLFDHRDARSQLHTFGFERVLADIADARARGARAISSSTTTNRISSIFSSSLSRNASSASSGVNSLPAVTFSTIRSRIRLEMSVQPSLTRSSSAKPPVWESAKFSNHFRCHPGLERREPLGVDRMVVAHVDRRRRALEHEQVVRGPRAAGCTALRSGAGADDADERLSDSFVIGGQPQCSVSRPLTRQARPVRVPTHAVVGADVRNNHPTDPEWFATLEAGWQRKWLLNPRRWQTGGFADEDLVKDGWTDISQRIRDPW